MATLPTSVGMGRHTCAKTIKSVFDHFNFYRVYQNMGGKKRLTVNRKATVIFANVFRQRFKEALKEFQLLHLCRDDEEEHQANTEHEQDGGNPYEPKQHGPDEGFQIQTQDNGTEAVSEASNPEEPEEPEEKLDEARGAGFCAKRMMLFSSEQCDDATTIVNLYLENKEKLKPILELFIPVNDDDELMRTSLMKRQPSSLVTILDWCMTAMLHPGSSGDDNVVPGSSASSTVADKPPMSRTEKIDLVIEILENLSKKLDITNIDPKLGDVVGPDGFRVTEIRASLNKLSPDDLDRIHDRCCQFLNLQHAADQKMEELEKEENISMIIQMLSDPEKRNLIAALYPEMSDFISIFDADNKGFVEAFKTFLKSYSLSQLGSITVSLLSRSDVE